MCCCNRACPYCVYWHYDYTGGDAVSYTHLDVYKRQDSYLIHTDNNASYVVRILSLVDSENTIQAIDLLNSTRPSALVKSNCLYSMTNLRNYYWLSDIKANFSTLSKWERRAFIASSYFLGDEGKHWRDNTKEQFLEIELLLRDWIASKQPAQNLWKLPL